MNQPTIFPPGTRSYFEPVTKREEVWLEEKTEMNSIAWLRCLTIGMIEQCENGCIAPVTVQRCVQELRTGFLNKIHSFLSSAVPEDSLYIPTVTGILGDETARMTGAEREKKHLVWGDVTLENHTEFEQITRFGEFSLVKMPVPRLTPVQEEMAEVAERIIAAISDYGSVVGDFNTIGADRICICLKHAHGSLSSLQEDMQYPVKLQRWFQHQRTCITLQEIMYENIGKKRMHLFLEDREDDQIECVNYSLESLLENEIALSDAEKDPVKAQGIILNLLVQLQKNVINGGTIMGSLGAEGRIVTMAIAKDPGFSERVHGLLYENREKCAEALQEQEKIRNFKTMRTIIKKDYEKIHAYTLSQINKYLPIGECGIIYLGGNHFESGFNHAQYAEYYDPFLLTNASLEKYIDDQPAKNVRFIIVEPVDYKST